jgi:hypothetical protein
VEEIATMTANEIVAELEREKNLLADLICLSGEQLLLLDAEDLERFDTLLERRVHLTVKVFAIDDRIEPWINTIQTDPGVSHRIMQQMRTLNDEIVRMANHVVLIDETIDRRLDLIHQKQGA